MFKTAKQREDFFWLLAENLLRVRCERPTRKLLSETHEQLAIAMVMIQKLVPADDENLHGAIEFCTVERANIAHVFKQLFDGGSN